PLAAATLLVAVPAAGARPGQPTGGGVRNAAQQRLSVIPGKGNVLVGQMTLSEKMAQLEMSGPTGPNGTPGQTLLDELRSGQVGSVLDLVGVNNINEAQQAALQSQLHT